MRLDSIAQPVADTKSLQQLIGAYRDTLHPALSGTYPLGRTVCLEVAAKFLARSSVILIFIQALPEHVPGTPARSPLIRIRSSHYVHSVVTVSSLKTTESSGIRSMFSCLMSTCQDNTMAGERASKPWRYQGDNLCQ